MLTAEPGGTQIGEKIREVLLSPEYKAMFPVTELLLYNASRAQLVNELIKPSLELGHIIISDRYSDSTVAYQGYGRGISLDLISRLDKISTGGLKPQLTILLDLPPREGLARNRKDERKKTDRLELETLRFHEKVRAGFLKLQELEPGRIALVDVSSGTVEEIHSKILEIVTEKIGSLIID